MGNCCVIQREKTWVDEEDEDWEFSERQGLLNEERMTEVKIRISKKQLEKLLGKNNLQVEKILEEIVNNGVVNVNQEHHKEAHWKPRLRSIPEVPEES
ncbi:hypothetical protein LUZ60_001403 [Juncus effusus]|nr:hypothetical protein LUZ60_001403 [Juncus effusus]